jgi:DNA-binding MarR family transcriptional regulator
MQLLPDEINKQGDGSGVEPTSADCARAILNVVPPVVRVIRKMMREHRLPELSVPQFRALGLLAKVPDVSLSVVAAHIGSVADHIGSSLPAASRMIDGMVAKNLIARKECCRDRRQVSLQLTKLGRSAYLESREATHRQLDKQLAVLSEEQRQTIYEAMLWLGNVFGADRIETAEGTPATAEENS